MPVKSVYVRRNDEVLWAWAEAEAAAKGVALSSWLSQLIQERKFRLGAKQDDDLSIGGVLSQMKLLMDVVEGLAVSQEPDPHMEGS